MVKHLLTTDFEEINVNGAITPESHECLVLPLGWVRGCMTQQWQPWHGSTGQGLTERIRKRQTNGVTATIKQGWFWRNGGLRKILKRSK